MANVQVLQNAANRFANVAGFTPIAVDGSAGPRTLDAVQRALSYISIETDSGPISPAVSSQAAAFAANAARSTSVLTANAAQVGAFLNYVADISHLPAVYGPQIVPQTNAAVAAASNILPTIHTNSAAASVLNTLKGLQPWQKVALGALAVLGALAISTKLRERKQQLQGYGY